MKISEMLKREDFYTINEETLKEYYANTGNSTTEMYIYPRLNAIVTSHPGEKVKNFLLTEYSAQSPIKNIIARTYVKACLSTKGLLADNEINVKAKIGDETLIYPCNKKYRIFDFENNTVSVIIKKGFKKDDLTHEIEYRKNDDLPSFVPKIIRYDSNGYTEEIIHGKPVARIRDRQKYNELKKHAYTIFREHYNSQDNMVSSFSYIEQLEKKIHTCASLKCKDFVLLNSVVEKLGDVARNNNPIEVGFSHGDLQAGNIWVDDNNNLFIIDWESWSVRSIWYDQAVLFEKLRPGSIKSYLYSSSPNSQKAIVLLEDIVFHLNELNSLPDNFGEKSFYQYVDEINTWLSEDTTNEQKK